MDQLVGDSQVAPGTQAVGSGAVTYVSTAWTSPVPTLADFMDVLSHPDIQTRAAPEAPALATHNALGGVVAGAVCLLVDSLLPVTRQNWIEIMHKQYERLEHLDSDTSFEGSVLLHQHSDLLPGSEHCGGPMEVIDNSYRLQQVDGQGAQRQVSKSANAPK